MFPPRFLCIGARQSGTAWFYEYLKQHPSVCLPPVREVHFFTSIPRLPKIAQPLDQASFGGHGGGG